MSGDCRRNDAEPEGVRSIEGPEVARLKREISRLNECLRLKNIALDAMHWVWCDGGCVSGVHRHAPADLTEACVAAAERNTRRLRAWLTNAAFRAQWQDMSGEARQEWLASHAACDI